MFNKVLFILSFKVDRNNYKKCQSNSLQRNIDVLIMRYAKVFKCRQHLYRHKLTCCINLASYTCECSKSFSRKNHLKRHQLICKGDSSKLCSICGKEFYKTSNFKRHLLTHSKEDEYICGACGKKYVHEGYYNSHIATCDRMETRKAKSDQEQHNYDFTAYTLPAEVNNDVSLSMINEYMDDTFTPLANVSVT